MSESEKWRKLTFKQIQPIHIGAGSYGVVNETRIFIPGWTMWGALTKAYNLTIREPLSENQNIFENISCFWPSFDEKGKEVLFPYYKKGVLYLGENYPDSKFRAMFVDTYASTAVLPISRAAKDESLHEINVILPQCKADFCADSKHKNLYWSGIVKIGQDKSGNVNSFLTKGLKITVGGDTRYGFGLMELIATIDLSDDAPEIEDFKKANYVKINDNDGKRYNCKLELLVEATAYKDNSDSKNDGNLKIKDKGFYYVPCLNSDILSNLEDYTLKKGKLVPKK